MMLTFLMSSCELDLFTPSILYGSILFPLAFKLLADIDKGFASNMIDKTSKEQER